MNKEEPTVTGWLMLVAAIAGFLFLLYLELANRHADRLPLARLAYRTVGSPTDDKTQLQC